MFYQNLVAEAKSKPAEALPLPPARDDAVQTIAQQLQANNKLLVEQLCALTQAPPVSLPVPHITIQNPNPTIVAASAEAMMASLRPGLTLQ